jgi:hypothetical protein
MILQSFAAFGLAVLAGFGLIHLVWKNDTFWALALKIFLGIGAGLGMTSCLYFLRLLLFPGQGGYLLIQAGFLGAILIALGLRRRFSFVHALPRLSISPLQGFLGFAAGVVLLASIYYAITFARLTPHGEYDAQAIWNLRARSIYRLGDAWENAFSPLLNRNFHMDYPILLPLSVVGGWNTLGGEVLRVPAVIGMLFLFGMAGVIFSTVALLRSGSQAALALITLLATPSLLFFSKFQAADIPLTYFFLAVTSLLILAGRQADRGPLFLAGLMAGLAAWTKNEGLPFLLVIAVCTVLMFDARRLRTTLPALLAGLAFPGLTIVLFKGLISANNDLFAGNGFLAIVSKFFEPARYTQIASHLLPELLRLGGWPLSIVLVLVVYGVILGVKQPAVRTEKFVWVIPLGQLVIYLLIYMITPHDLEWHLNYSMDRLLVHLFPPALLSFFLWVNPPESLAVTTDAQTANEEVQ